MSANNISENPDDLAASGSDLYILFERTRSPDHLDAAIRFQDSALAKTATGRPHPQNWLDSLSASLRMRYILTGNSSDLTRAIFASEEANVFPEIADPIRAFWFKNLACSLSDRCELIGVVEDLNQAIAVTQDAVNCLNGSIMGLFLDNLGNLLQLRFERTGTREDIDDAITTFQKRIDFISDLPRGAISLFRLACALQLRYYLAGSENDLDRWIEASREAATSAPQGDPARVYYFNNLGIAFVYRFKRYGRQCDLNEAIVANETSVNLFPCINADRSASIGNLGITLLTRFYSSKSENDLKRAVLALREAIDTCPVNSPFRTIYLRELSSGFRKRLQITGLLVDRKDALETLQATFRSLPERDPERILELVVLAGFMYSQLGASDTSPWNDDFNKGMNTLEEGVIGAPIEARGEVLAYLSHLLMNRYRWNGALEDLNRAVAVGEAALESASLHDERRRALQNILGVAFMCRFERFGKEEELDKAFVFYRMALDSVPMEDPFRAVCMLNFNSALICRYERKGATSDLNDAIMNFEQAAKIFDDDPENQKTALNNLSIALLRRFEQTGSTEDLNRATELTATLNSISGTDRSKSVHLNSQANALLSRFRRTNSMDDINRALATFEAALALLPTGSRPLHLANYGSAYMSRFQLSGSIDDLERTIDLYDEATELMPSDFASQWMLEGNFGVALEELYVRTESLMYLDKAISKYEDAVSQIPVDDVCRGGVLLNLGRAYSRRACELGFRPAGSEADTRRACDVFEQAAQLPSTPPTIRLFAACRAVMMLSSLDAERSYRILKSAIALLPSVGRYTVGRRDQQHAISKFAGFASSAAAWTLQFGHEAGTAVELVDAGRCIIHSHILEIRTDVKGLPEDIANQYETLKAILDPPSHMLEQQIHAESQGHEVNYRHHALLSLEALTEQIRQIDGFQDFRKPLGAQEAMNLAEHGPIIILNINPIGLRNDALIVKYSEIISFSLTRLDVSTLNTQATLFRSAINQITQSTHSNGTDELDNTSNPEQQIFEVLKYLWTAIVDPVLQELGYTEKPPEGTVWPKIWWCPTGVLSHLPIHAAGIYNDPLSLDCSLMDRVVSSYTSTLRALKYSRTIVAPSERHNVLIAAMCSTPNYRSLPFARHEAYRVRQILWHQPEFYISPVKIQPNRQEFCEDISDKTIVHLVCHAEENEEDPSSSGLMLEDGCFTVSEISQMKLRGGALLYLSACGTAVNRSTFLEDEIITLTGAFHVAGFARVVGTLWEAEDRVAFEVASTFYERLAGDPRRSAEALHFAVLTQRQKHPNEPSLWASYMFTGA